jgi:NAD(P)-dependent dehydrogenase (short-subunit alcohol dehydrogenase family)
MDLELARKVVLVTGGTDGLGLALAERLVEREPRLRCAAATPSASAQRRPPCGAKGVTRWRNRSM